MSELKDRKCTACGGELKVNGKQAVCEYCGSTYDIDDGISIKEVSITNIGNLLKRGKEYLAKNDFEKAKEYLEKAKDIDIENQGVKLFEEEIKVQENDYFSAKDAIDSIEYQKHLKKQEEEKKQQEIDKRIKDFGKVEEATLEKLNDTVWKSTKSEKYYVFKNSCMNTYIAQKEYDGEKEYTQWIRYWSHMEKIGHKFYQDGEYAMICYRPYTVDNKKDNSGEVLDDRCLEIIELDNYTTKNNYDIDAYHKLDIAGDNYLIEHRRYRDLDYPNSNYMLEAGETFEKVDELEAREYFRKIKELNDLKDKEEKKKKGAKIGSFLKPFLIIFGILFLFTIGLTAGLQAKKVQQTRLDYIRRITEGTEAVAEQSKGIEVSPLTIYFIILGVCIGFLILRYVVDQIKIRQIKQEETRVEKEAIAIQKKLNAYPIEE